MMRKLIWSVFTVFLFIGASGSLSKSYAAVTSSTYLHGELSKIFKDFLAKAAPHLPPNKVTGDETYLVYEDGEIRVSYELYEGKTWKSPNSESAVRTVRVIIKGKDGEFSIHCDDSGEKSRAEDYRCNFNFE